MKTLQYDEIHVENLEVFANHGVFPEETSLGQKFVISLTMYVDTRKAGKTDCLEESVHYGEVSSFMTAYTKNIPGNSLRRQQKTWQKRCCCSILF